MSIKMRMSLFAGVAVLLIATIAIAVSLAVQSSASDTQSKESGADGQWEYLIVAGGNVNLTSLSSGQFSSTGKLPDGSFKEASVLGRNFDKLGAKGWELVSVYGLPNDPIYYFKRPKDRR